MNNEYVISDYIGYGSASPAVVREFLKNADGDILIEVDSFGGSVFAGVAIAQAIRSYDKGKVRILVGAVAASAASFIIMAGDELRIHENSTIMIHRASLDTYGNADELRKDADLLESIDNMILKMYEGRVKVSREELVDLFAKESWFVGSDEIEKVFKVDEVIEAIDRETPANLSDEVKKAENIAAKIDAKCKDRVCNLKHKMEDDMNDEKLIDLDALIDEVSDSATETDVDEVVDSSILAAKSDEVPAPEVDTATEANKATDEIAPYDKELTAKVVELTKEVSAYRAKMKNLREIVNMGIDMGVDADTLIEMIESGSVAKASEIALSGKVVADGAVTAGGTVNEAETDELTEIDVLAKLSDEDIAQFVRKLI